MLYRGLLILLTLALVMGIARAASPELQAARTAVAADSALSLYHIVLARDGSVGEGPAALARLLDYFCFTQQADSLAYYRKHYRNSTFRCPAIDTPGECWRIQLGAFGERDNAFNYTNRLLERLTDIEVLQREDRYLVLSKCYSSKKAARSAARQWRQEQIVDDYLLRRFK